MPLMLTRRLNEAVVIEEILTIRVVEITGRKVKLEITGPKEIRILREELLHPEKDSGDE